MWPVQYQRHGLAGQHDSFSVAANPTMTGAGLLNVTQLAIHNWTNLTDNMTGGTMTVGSGGIVNTGQGNNYFNAGATTIGATAPWSSSMPMTLNDAATGTTFDTTGGNITLSGALGGGGALNKAGAGTLTLTTANSYAGGTTVSGGTLQLGNALALGATTAGVTVNGGVLGLSSYNVTVGAVTLTSGMIAGTGTLTGTSYNVQSGLVNVVLAGSNVALTESNGGTTVLNDANTYGGGTTVSGGVLQLGNAGALGSGGLIVNGGSLDLSGNTVSVPSFGSGFSNAGVVTNNGAFSAVFTVNQSTGTAYHGQINDGQSTVALVKTGSGTIALLGADNYSGGTTLQSGGINVGNVNALGNGGLTVNGGTLDLGGYSPVSVSSLSGTGGLIANSNGASKLSIFTVNQSSNTAYSGQISDGTYGITLVKQGSGMLTLSGNNTYSNGTNVLFGTLQLGNTGALGSGALAVNGGTLDLAGYSVTVPSFSGAGGAVTNSGAANASLTVNQAGVTNDLGQIADGPTNTTALVKQGSGMLVLSGANIYSGGTTISGGTLQLNAINALGTGGLTANGGVVDLNGNVLLLTNTNAFNNTNALTSLSGSGGVITDNLSTGYPFFDVNQSVNTIFGGSFQVGAAGGQLVLDKYGSGSLTLAGNEHPPHGQGLRRRHPAHRPDRQPLHLRNVRLQHQHSGDRRPGDAGGLGQWQVNDQSTLSGSGTLDVTAKRHGTGLQQHVAQHLRRRDRRQRRQCGRERLQRPVDAFRRQQQLLGRHDAQRRRAWASITTVPWARAP